jgi:hypothetical protein
MDIFSMTEESVSHVVSGKSDEMMDTFWPSQIFAVQIAAVFQISYGKWYFPTEKVAFRGLIATFTVAEMCRKDTVSGPLPSSNAVVAFII